MENGYYYFDRLSSFCRVFYDIYIGNNICVDEKKVHYKNTIQSIPLIRHYPKEYAITDYLGPIYKPTLIKDNIYVGSSFNAASFELMKELNIKYIINVTQDIPNYFKDHGIKYLKIPIKDNNMDSIDKYLDLAYQKILEFQEENNGNILIHCFVGASRSVTVAMYYMIIKYNMTVDDSLNYLKQNRYLIHPSVTLINSLIKKTQNSLSDIQTINSDNVSNQ
jgi:protein-tyrosine phosphatase